jgi:hypothetical protein
MTINPKEISYLHPHPASNKDSDFFEICTNSGIKDMEVCKSFKIVKIGNLIVEFFEMSEIGSGLNKHVHGEDYAHISIVTQGSIKAFSHDWEKIVKQGQLVDFKVGQPHGMIALEKDTKVINVRKFEFVKDANLKLLDSKVE